MKPIEIIIPPPTPEGLWCHNASIIVIKMNQYSQYLDNENELFEVVFRERIGTDGNIYACYIKPYTWEVFNIRRVFNDLERNKEDPRIWLWNGIPFLSFTLNHTTIAFTNYRANEQIPCMPIILPFRENGKEGVIQKNWGFFEHNGKLCILYKPGHIFQVIELNLEKNEVFFADPQLPWTYEEYNGGSPPVYMESEGVYYIFCHKMYKYDIWALSFQKCGDSHWKVKSYTPQKINTIKQSETEYHFVSGAVYDRKKEQWILSGGIRDQHVCFWTIPHKELLTKMVNIDFKQQSLDSVCFLITGKLTLEFTAQLIYSFERVPHKVVSTWSSENPEFIDHLKKRGFDVLLNEKPPIQTSANLQSIAALHGLQKIKEKGFQYCIRTRTDMLFRNINHFNNILIPQLSDTKLLCLCGMRSENPDLWYYLDLLIAGSVNKMIQFYSPMMEEGESRCAEIFWLENYLGRKVLTKEDILEAFSFCGESFYQQPILCEWMEKGWEILQYYILKGRNFIWYA